MTDPIKDILEDFDVINKLTKDRPKCPRCDAEMLDIQACHFVCPHCSGVLDCSDIG